MHLYRITVIAMLAGLLLSGPVPADSLTAPCLPPCRLPGQEVPRSGGNSPRQHGDTRQVADMLMKAAVLHQQDALLETRATPSFGPASAPVAVVEFFDYSCRVCGRMAPVLEQLMKAHPGIRVVFKAWPAAKGHAPMSLAEAKAGLQIWQQNGPRAYMIFHDALLSAGAEGGELSRETFQKAVVSVGSPVARPESGWWAVRQVDALARTLTDIGDREAALANTDRQARALGLTRLPAMVIMPVHNPTIDSITVLTGMTNLDALQAAVEKASHYQAEPGR